MIVNLGIYIWVRVRGTLGDRGTKGYHMRIPLKNAATNQNSVPMKWGISNIS